MCRSEIRNVFDIHAACQDRNCSVSTVRKLLDKAGPEVLGEKDVYGRVVSNVLFCSRVEMEILFVPHILTQHVSLYSLLSRCSMRYEEGVLCP